MSHVEENFWESIIASLDITIYGAVYEYLQIMKCIINIAVSHVYLQYGNIPVW